jgi:hypothetical protein
MVKIVAVGFSVFVRAIFMQLALDKNKDGINQLH